MSQNEKTEKKQQLDKDKSNNHIIIIQSFINIITIVEINYLFNSK